MDNDNSRIYFQDGEVLHARELNATIENLSWTANLRSMRIGVIGFDDSSQVSVEMDRDRARTAKVRLVNLGFMFADHTSVYISESPYLSVACRGLSSFLVVSRTDPDGDGYLDPNTGPLVVRAVADLAELNLRYCLPVARIRLSEDGRIVHLDEDFAVPAAELTTPIRLQHAQVAQAHRVDEYAAQCQGLLDRILKTVEEMSTADSVIALNQLRNLNIVAARQLEDTVSFICDLTMGLNSCDPYVAVLTGRDPTVNAEVELVYDRLGLMMQLHAHFRHLLARLNAYVQVLKVESEELCLVECSDVPHQQQHSLYRVANLPPAWSSIELVFPNIKNSRPRAYRAPDDRVHNLRDQERVRFTRRDDGLYCEFDFDANSGTWRNNHLFGQSQQDLMVWCQSPEVEFNNL